MPSAKHDRSLVRRVAALSAAATILAATVSVMATTALALRAVAREQESSLVDHANLLVTELEEGSADRAMAEEAAELQASGLSVLVRRNGSAIAGTPSLAATPPRGCALIGGDRPERVCAPSRVPPRGTELWVAAPDRAHLYRSAFYGSAALALLLALGMAAAGGTVAARWATAPLLRLRQALLAADVGRPATVELPPPAGVSEVDAIARALEELLARLDSELQRARRFASDAAHELRTPLTKILGELELIREAPPDPEALKVEVARLHDRVAALAALTERLLALVTPAPDAAREVVSLSTLAETVQDDLAGADRVTLELPTEPPRVSGDRALLASMLQNGVDNALKFSTGRVALRVAARDGFWVIQIDDDGPGIPPAERERVFEQFYRDPQARARAGHGLGLALVRHIAEIHGGHAAFVDGAKGARLEITLPQHAG